MLDPDPDPDPHCKPNNTITVICDKYLEAGRQLLQRQALKILQARDILYSPIPSINLIKYVIAVLYSKIIFVQSIVQSIFSLSLSSTSFTSKLYVCSTLRVHLFFFSFSYSFSLFFTTFLLNFLSHHFFFLLSVFFFLSSLITISTVFWYSITLFFFFFYLFPLTVFSFSFLQSPFHSIPLNSPTFQLTSLFLPPFNYFLVLSNLTFPLSLFKKILSTNLFLLNSSVYPMPCEGVRRNWPDPSTDWPACCSTADSAPSTAA
jgi:hypothetical protein